MLLQAISYSQTELKGFPDGLGQAGGKVRQKVSEPSLAEGWHFHADMEKAVRKASLVENPEHEAMLQSAMCAALWEFPLMATTPCLSPSRLCAF